MKRTVKKVDKQTYIIEEFNTFGELINTNDSRTQNFGNARTSDDDSWYGASYDEAVKMLRYGWQDDEKVKQMCDTINNNLSKLQDEQKMTFKNDIVGYAPIVPLALKGVPQSMINTARKPKKSKVINLIIDVSVSCGTSVEEILEWGAKMTAKIMSLEKQGYRVKIEVVNTYTRDDWTSKVHALKVLVKGENQPFDIKRMMFPLAHGAFFRRIGFDWYERLPEAQHFGEYGYSLIQHNKKHAEAVKKQISDTENSYYICNKEDINEVLKGVA